MVHEDMYDFLVIRGGFAGAVAARDLGRDGFRVGLVEARDVPYGTTAAIPSLLSEPATAHLDVVVLEPGGVVHVRPPNPRPAQ